MKKLLCLLLVLLLTGCQLPEIPNIPETTGATTQPEETTLPLETEQLQPLETWPEETVPPVIDLQELEDTEFVRVLDYLPTVQQALAYATVDNFASCRIYDFTDVYLRAGTVRKLQQVCAALAEQGLGLRIWDGFRPAAAQAKLWEICPDATYVSHPVTGSRSHCRGNTVDLTLVDLKTGEALTMPTGYDNFSAYADRDYSDCSPEAAKNAKLLEDTMIRHGFRGYFAEWWHFTDEDPYPVDEYFDPAIPTLWRANCQEYISLRQEPDDPHVLAKLPRGALMQLQSWEGRYAQVRSSGQTGYVLTSYIMPQEDSYFRDCLDTVAPTNRYAYEQLLLDMAALEAQYPDTVHTGTIGTSELGRKIPVLRLGDPKAQYHVLLQGTIHGREHLTAWLLMAMADYWLDHGLLGYGDVCYHLIPMVNPDGAVISQTQTLTQAQREIYQKDLQLGLTELSEAAYAKAWKANGLGVDLNRNFPAGWEPRQDRPEPSSQLYPGEKPFSAAEAAALRDYTLQFDFDVTVSYHATGSMIFYEYGQKQPVNQNSLALAKAVRQVTGYTLADSEGIDGAGYKDWVMEELEIPSLTVEVGCEEAALEEREIYSIFVRNFRVLPAIARWLQMK